MAATTHAPKASTPYEQFQRHRIPPSRAPYLTGAAASSAAATPAAEEEDDVDDDEQDDVEVSPSPYPPEERWEELDHRMLRAPTPDMYEVFPRDPSSDDASDALPSLELFKVRKDGSDGFFPNDSVLWCLDNSHVPIEDLENTWQNCALFCRVRNVEQSDVNRAKVDTRNPPVWEGKLIMVHYMSYRKADLAQKVECLKMAYVSEVTYDDINGFVLTKEHYVRAGLLWPFVGPEIGCWIRRYFLLSKCLGKRKDKDGYPLKVRIAAGAPRDILVALCPYFRGRV